MSARVKRLVAHVANLGERCVEDLVGKPERKGILGRPRLRLEDNLKWFLKKWYEGNGLNRCGSGQRQLVGSCECDNESSGYVKWQEFLD